MARNATAVVRMEEMYLRLTIEFDNDEYKDKINKAIDEVCKELKSKPESITQRNISDCAGNISIEFDVECENRDAGILFKNLLNKLNIKQTS